MQLQPNRPELAPLRGKEPLDSWVRSFAKRDPDRGKRYLQALALFLGRTPPGGAPDWQNYVAARSPETQRAYQAAVVEFFEWLVVRHKAIVPPHEVTRQDAVDYAEWLAHRGSGAHDFDVVSEKLKDGDLPVEHRLWKAVEKLQSARLSELARALPPDLRRDHPPGPDQVATQLCDERWLHERLTWLVQQRVLTRSPLMCELRLDDPRAGLGHEIDPDVYTYTLPELQPVARSTIALRLSALSSFWRIMQRGENAGDKALLDYNVFEDALERASRGVAAEKRLASQERRPGPELIQRLIAAIEGPRLVDKRNVALVWFLLLTGCRISETLRLRRGEPNARERQRFGAWLDLSKTPPEMVLVRKGGQPQRLQMPAFVLSSLSVFWAELSDRVVDGISSSEPAYRYRLLAKEPDAPLFPPLSLWGKNRAEQAGDWGPWGYKKSMRRQAVQQLLCRAAKDAGLTDKERARIHPHGFRHAAATGALEGGKNIREVQKMLGHVYLSTTEGYLADEMDPSHLNAENEILDWLARGGGPRPPRPEPPRPPGRVETIRTYGEEVRPSQAVPDRPRPSRTVTPPGHQLPIGPEPPAPVAPLALPAIGLVALGPEELPPIIRPYEQMHAGVKPSDLVWSSTPQARFIEQKYPKLPVLPHGLGLGKESLLVWTESNAPLPWPVLAPAQAYPEVVEPGSLLGHLEALYDDWRTTRPSQTASLALWLNYLGTVTVGLEERLAGAYLWVPFEAAAAPGRDLRAHETSWLVSWFRENAHTFTVAWRRFAGVPRPEPGEPGAEYWERINSDLEALGAVPSVPELPVWFFEDDPVHAIFTRDPDEWKAFCRWLTRLTGIDPSPSRTEHREEQIGFWEESLAARRQRARGIIEQFYSLVDEARDPTRDRETAARRLLSEQMRELRDLVKREYGIELPSQAPDDSHKRQQRIAELVEAALPRGGSHAAATNVLGDSRLFRPDAFRISQAGRTLEHTKEFREEFAREHWGQDSQCVMRRVARALWERVRGHEFEKKKRPRTLPEERHELFVTMLALLAYVVPCPPEFEKAMVEAGYRASSPADMARKLRERMQDLRDKKRPAADGLDEIAHEALSVIQSPSDPEVLEAERARHGTRTANASRVLPHPLRLVAAGFWPV